MGARTLLGPLERTNLNHWTMFCSKAMVFIFIVKRISVLMTLSLCRSLYTSQYSFEVKNNLEEISWPEKYLRHRQKDGKSKI
jgi:hypothetical protein